MLRVAAESIRTRFLERDDLVPPGFSWAFVVVIDLSMLTIVAVATAQRPTEDLQISLLACAIAMSQSLIAFIWGIRHHAVICWLSTTIAAALFLFATSTPIDADFAPLALVLMVGVVGGMSSVPASLAAAGSSAVVLLLAAAAHRLDIVLYLPVLAMGWLVGYLMHTQQQLILRQQEAQRLLAIHAADDERRRIAREVHDVIAHSLSITLLHLTGARRELQQDGDIAEAVEALEQAEELGRQAMGDIRRTVGLLDSSPMRAAAEPGAAEIGSLVADFRNAGLDVTLTVTGRIDRVSAAVGLALYRIAQESLSNIAKHAPDSAAEIRLDVRRRSVELTVSNQLREHALVLGSSAGRGVVGMRQRVELLGGQADIGPGDEQWRVRALIPLEANGRC
ncbi:sensor histidine kinase [Mycolicibacterium brumae]|uniref:histidine kinase n=1 Tax=Mycolicibacterium brumae TaxID=85968 RepID=A0A2G5P7B8_9MYCO|nr:histidine kinase [Mycolicibacterium brumae]PIB73990.1 two-component sensor histidine kinase [Mycolicibacterium brumae]RWA21433.1 hypothetical protein MBRU_14560 [Mycolicibacterium brumae DSM 44177]UWW07358.1 histidine kinase [Mycolicibacterium brumae]